MEASKLIAVRLGVLYKTSAVMTNIKLLIMLLQSKYQNPMEKQADIITANIRVSIIRGIIVFPLAYQQINAKTGESKVIPYHIII